MSTHDNSGLDRHGEPFDGPGTVATHDEAGVPERFDDPGLRSLTRRCTTRPTATSPTVR